MGRRLAQVYSFILIYGTLAKNDRKAFFYFPFSLLKDVLHSFGACAQCWACKGEKFNMYTGSKKVSPNAFHVSSFFFFEKDPKPPLILGFMCCVVICVSNTVLSLKTTTTKQQMVKNEVWICCCLYGLDLEDWSSLYHVLGMLILFLLGHLQTESVFLSKSSQLETGTRFLAS